MEAKETTQANCILSPVKKHLYDKLQNDKIKINWNKNPISMSLFLSFLTVEVKRSDDHLGSNNGWTLLKNDELKLKISGGIVGNIELLDNLQFGINLSNPYNNYVNPFYLFGIMTREGQRFFIDYYKDDIEKIISDQKSEIKHLESKLEFNKSLLELMKAEINNL